MEWPEIETKQKLQFMNDLSAIVLSLMNADKYKLTRCLDSRGGSVWVVEENKTISLS